MKYNRERVFFGIPTKDVREIVYPLPLPEPPVGDSKVLGVADFRGEFSISVIDLRKHLVYVVNAARPKSKWIVVRPRNRFCEAAGG
ncbi:MAG: chemotaxis protein CheW [Polyangiales bacterium]